MAEGKVSGKKLKGGVRYPNNLPGEFFRGEGGLELHLIKKTGREEGGARIL